MDAPLCRARAHNKSTALVMQCGMRCASACGDRSTTWCFCLQPVYRPRHSARVVVASLLV
eukprot:2033980-Prymnesium_polylepis.2